MPTFTHTNQGKGNLFGGKKKTRQGYSTKMVDRKSKPIQKGRAAKGIMTKKGKMLPRVTPKKAKKY